MPCRASVFLYSIISRANTVKHHVSLSWCLCFCENQTKTPQGKERTSGSMHCPFLFPAPSLNGKGRTDDLMHSATNTCWCTARAQNSGRAEFSIRWQPCLWKLMSTLFSLYWSKLSQLGRKLVTRPFCHRANAHRRIFLVSHLQCEFVVWSIKWALGTIIQQPAQGGRSLCVFSIQGYRRSEQRLYWKTWNTEASNPQRVSFKINQ